MSLLTAVSTERFWSVYSFILYITVHKSSVSFSQEWIPSLLLQALLCVNYLLFCISYISCAALVLPMLSKLIVTWNQCNDIVHIIVLWTRLPKTTKCLLSKNLSNMITAYATLQNQSRIFPVLHSWQTTQNSMSSRPWPWVHSAQNCNSTNNTSKLFVSSRIYSVAQDRLWNCFRMHLFTEFHFFIKFHKKWHWGRKPKNWEWDRCGQHCITSAPPKNSSKSGWIGIFQPN